MSLPIDIHEMTEAEIMEAADFYDMRSPGLGSAFIDEFQQIMGKISEYPTAAPLIRGRLRTSAISEVVESPAAG